MADHKSAKKRIRQTIKRTARNKHIRTTVRTLIKKVREAILAGDASVAKEALKSALPKLDAAVTKGIYPRKTASRYISRLSKQVNKLS